MVFMKKLTLLLLLSFSFVGSTYANSYYWITDQLDIPIRSDKNFGQNIIRLLPSGTKLSLLQSTEDGWAQVQFDDTIGWIKSFYITSEEPARNQLKLLKREINALKLKVEFLEIRKKALTNKNNAKI